VSKNYSDTVAQFILDEINSTKSLEFADLLSVSINDFELGNSITTLFGHSKIEFLQSINLGVAESKIQRFFGHSCKLPQMSNRFIFEIKEKSREF
jgi:hypothetical protein